MQRNTTLVLIFVERGCSYLAQRTTGRASPPQEAEALRCCSWSAAWRGVVVWRRVTPAEGVRVSVLCWPPRRAAADLPLVFPPRGHFGRARWCRAARVGRRRALDVRVLRTEQRRGGGLVACAAARAALVPAACWALGRGSAGRLESLQLARRKALLCSCWHRTLSAVRAAAPARPSGPIGGPPLPR